MKSDTHYSNGKLLISGEYVVLDGALSLAIPTKFGQSLEITTLDKPQIIWKSLNHENTVWFEDEFDIRHNENFKALNPKNDLSGRLLQILRAAKKLNPNFLKTQSGYEVTSKLEFPKDWGLGSSSTLINNIAQWANVDAFKLLEQTFGGSGYDIACAQHDTALTYQIGNNNQKEINGVTFNPSFKNALYFVHLNKKQNSRDGIVQYKENTSDKKQIIKDISDITSKLISCTDLPSFNVLLNKHEQLISSIIHQVPVKDNLFSNFKGSVKSLGAWGGDFVLVTSDENPKDYFKQKGYHTILPFSEMIK